MTWKTRWLLEPSVLCHLRDSPGALAVHPLSSEPPSSGWGSELISSSPLVPVFVMGCPLSEFASEGQSPPETPAVYMFKTDGLFSIKLLPQRTSYTKDNLEPQWPLQRFLKN